jgi:predicted adenine nucleotide alpha hydrolase (AANH) superfamily ATPase
MPERFLLHTCCAPCGIAVIDELRHAYDLTVFFYNPNIHPREEYEKRKGEVIRVCTEWSVPMIDGDYDVSEWDRRTVGLESDREGGKRCPVCFALRLERTAVEAKRRGINIMSTTLTSGRQKSAQVIFPIGEAIAARHGLTFLAEDWKKNGREEKSRQMVRERGLYRQDYCGCRHSLAEAAGRRAKRRK